MKIGLVGIGKIARDQHVPALAMNESFELAATASRHGRIAGVESHETVQALLAARPDIAAMSLCTPPGGRFDQAVAVLEAGRHLMLEKPPTTTMSEAEALVQLAAAKGVTLFTTWHSREAAAVDAARTWLAGKRIDAVRIDWREDIRQWHPGQDWILAAGGFGVFDPGINALSIATRILPDPITVESARLSIPSNRACPIAATLELRSGRVAVGVGFDFLQTGKQTWDIAVETEAGIMRLRDGGSRLELPDDVTVAGPNEEYPRLYRQFAASIARGESDIDLRPLQLVADAFLVGEREIVAAFDF